MFGNRLYYGFISFLICSLLFSFIIGGSNPNNEEADKLYVQATEELEKAVLEEENSNYTKCLKHYMNAQRLIKEIAEKYPSSNKAVKIGQNKGVKVKGTDITYTYRTLTKKIEQIRPWAEAEKSLVDTAIAIAKGIKNTYYYGEARALRDIATAMAEAGKFKKPIEIAQGIEMAHRKNSVPVVIAIGMAKAGKFTKAVEIAQGIEDVYKKPRALKGIAIAMAKAGKFKEAVEVAKELTVVNIPSWGVVNKDDKKETLVKIAMAGAEAKLSKKEEQALIKSILKAAVK